jgi:hypothetical protein
VYLALLLYLHYCFALTSVNTRCLSSSVQCIDAAHDQFIVALRSARSLLHSTQRALATCAEKLRLEMSLQPAASAAREQHTAALQQLQDLTEETMDSLAARLTSQFLPACNLSVDEVDAACHQRHVSVQISLSC